MPVLWEAPHLGQLLDDLKGQGSVSVVTDFDRTLTHGTCIECHLLVAQSSATDHNGFLDAIRPVAQAAKLPHNEKPAHLCEDGWWNTYHQVMKEKEVRHHHMQAAVEGHDEAMFRPGVAEFYSHCHGNGVPFVVVSAGLHNVVQCVFEKEINHLPVPPIVANTMDAEGTVHPVGKPITSSRKQTSLLHADDGVRDVLQKHPITVVIGDKPNDSLVASHHPRELCPDSSHHVVRVGIMNPTSRYGIDAFQEAFDVVLDGMHDEAFEFIQSNVLKKLL